MRREAPQQIKEAQLTYAGAQMPAVDIEAASPRVLALVHQPALPNKRAA